MKNQPVNNVTKIVTTLGARGINEYLACLHYSKLIDDLRYFFEKQLKHIS